MNQFGKLFPELALQLEGALSKLSNCVDKVHEAHVTRVTFDPEADAGYVYVKSGRQLNAIEQHVIGVKHCRTIEIPGIVWMNADLDNFDRLTGVEILAASNGLKARLSELATLYR